MMIKLGKYLKLYSIFLILSLILLSCSQNQIPAVVNINLEKSKSPTNITAIQNNGKANSINFNTIKEKFDYNKNNKIIKVTFDRPYSNPAMDLFIGLDAVKSYYTADFYIKVPGFSKQLLRDKSVGFKLKFRWNKETYLLELIEVNMVLNYVKFKLKKLY